MLVTKPVLDYAAKSRIVRYFLPEWFRGTDAEIGEYIFQLKKEFYQQPELRQFLADLHINVGDILADPYPYFLDIRWDWLWWSEYLGCSKDRPTIIAELRKRPWRELSQIVGSGRPSLKINEILERLAKREDRYLDIDTLKYVTKPHSWHDDVLGLTSTQEYRLVALQQSLRWHHLTKSLKDLPKDFYYNLDDKAIVTKSLLSTFAFCSIRYRVCSNDAKLYSLALDYLGNFPL